MGAALSQPPGSDPPCFRICGQIFHRYGPLHPIPGESPRYSQLYIVETSLALQERMMNIPNNNTLLGDHELPSKSYGRPQSILSSI